MENTLIVLKNEKKILDGKTLIILENEKIEENKIRNNKLYITEII